MADKGSGVLAVASGGDESFAMPVAASMYSVKANYTGDKKLVFYILDGGMSKISISKINRILGHENVIWLRPDISKLEDLPKSDLLNEFAYMRLMLPEMVNEGLGRIIYLDGDTICTTSLHKIAKAYEPDYAVSAVRDYGGSMASSRYALKEVYEDLGIHPDTPMFNSGVMLVNIDEWKRQDILERCGVYLERYHSKVKLADQEALNAVLNGEWGEIDWKWNVQVGALQNTEAWEPSDFKKEIIRHKEDLLRDPHIVHFIGGRKPWKAGLTNPCRPLFTKYLKESRWFSTSEFYRWYAKWLLGASVEIGIDIIGR